MQSLIEQVRKLAEAQREADDTEARGRIASKPDLHGIAALLMRQRERVCIIATEMDAPALLAHMQAQQAVVDAAREFMAADWSIDSEPLTAKELRQVYKLRDALDAALEKVKDHE